MFKSVCIFFTTAFFLVGCAATSVTVPETTIAQNACIQGAPGWVLAGGAEGGLASVGSAKIGNAGLTFARTEALASARDELARSLSVKVNNMFKSFTQTTGIGDDQTVDKLAANVSRQVASQTLSGSKQAASWVSSCNEIFILVALDSTLLTEAAKQQTLSSLKNDNALWQQFLAKSGFDELDNTIAKELGGKPTVSGEQVNQ